MPLHTCLASTDRLGSGSGQELKNVTRSFHDLGLNDIIVNCSKSLINNYKLDKKFHLQNDNQKIVFIEILKIQFEKSPEILEVLSHLDEDKFYNCLIEKFLNTFTVKELASSSAYSSDEYIRIIKECTRNSMKN